MSRRPEKEVARKRKPTSLAKRSDAGVMLGRNPPMFDPCMGSAATKAQGFGDKAVAAELNNQRADRIKLHEPKLLPFFDEVKPEFCPLRRFFFDLLLIGMEKSNAAAVAIRLIKIRQAHGLSQAQLCRLLNLDQARVSKWEQGKARPKPEEAYLYVVRFGVTADWIYYGTEAGLSFQAAQKLGILS